MGVRGRLGKEKFRNFKVPNKGPFMSTDRRPEPALVRNNLPFFLKKKAGIIIGKESANLLFIHRPFLCWKTNDDTIMVENNH